jgi:hypothetical protein
MGDVWPWLLRAVQIRPGVMRPERLGLCLRTAEDRERVEGVCSAVAGGFNAVTGGSGERWVDFCAGLEPHFRPFAQEAVAMGLPLRLGMRFTPQRFEHDLVGRFAANTYLYYVGLGFWYALSGGRDQRLNRVTQPLNRMYRYLCWDGFGFKYGFFDYAHRFERVERLIRLDGYRAHAAMQGVGRSMWFRFMGDAERLVAEIRRFPDAFRGDLAGGLGLASVFVDTDRLGRVWDLAGQIPPQWRSEFQQGMVFALCARKMTDPQYFAECLAKLPAHRAAGARRATSQCDAIEADLRARGVWHAYRLWRESLAVWLDANLRYPLEAEGHESEDQGRTAPVASARQEMAK